MVSRSADQQGRGTRSRPPRRSSWNRSLSEGFGPIKQVGVSISIGFPLFVIGVIFLAILIVSLVETAGSLWVLAAGLAVAGFAAALSSRIL